MSRRREPVRIGFGSLGRGGECRNALKRHAVGKLLNRHGVSRWPDEVMNFNGVADVGRFEDNRAKLRPPVADPPTMF